MTAKTELTSLTCSSLANYIPTPMKKFHGYVFTKGKALSQTAANKTLETTLGVLGSSRAAQATAFAASAVVYSIVFVISQLAHLAPLAVVGGSIATTLILLYICPPAGFTLIGLFGAAATAALAKTHFWPSSDDSDTSSEESFSSDFQRYIQAIQSGFDEFNRSRNDEIEDLTVQSHQRAQFPAFNTCLAGCSKCHLRAEEEEDSFTILERPHNSTSRGETSTLPASQSAPHRPNIAATPGYLEPEAFDIDEAAENVPEDLSRTLYATDDEEFYQNPYLTSPSDDIYDLTALGEAVGTAGILDFSSSSDSSSSTSDSSIPEPSLTSPRKGTLEPIQKWFSNIFSIKSDAEKFPLEEDFLSTQ